jgi:phosphate transport system substrate-binding protein
MKHLALLGLALCGVAASQAAGNPWDVAPGPLRIEGPADMKDVAERWVAGFNRQHPEIAVQLRLRGTDVGLGALTTGRADIALAGRDATAPEIKGFEWIYRYRPLAVDVMNGSLDQPGRSAALAVLVHRANPLARIGVGDLARLFAPTPPGASHAWRDIGLAGDRATHAVHLAIPDAESGTGAFFRARVLAGARALPWDQVVEVRQPTDAETARRLAAIVAQDRDALAVAPLASGLPDDVKVLALAADGEDALLPTAATVASRRYALGRVAHAYVNAAPARPIDPSHAHPLDPRCAEFLRYVLGPQGQQDVAAAAQYLPLAEREAASQAARLR